MATNQVARRVAGQRHADGGLVAQGLGDYGKTSQKSDSAILSGHTNALIERFENEKHGTSNAYGSGCRCAECKAFEHERYLKRKERKAQVVTA